VGVPELEIYRQQFDRLRIEAEEMTAGLTEAQFNHRPGPGQWSIEECLSHYAMLSQTQVNSITKAIDDAKARGITGTGPFDYSSIDRLLVQLTEPPVRFSVPAPRSFVPLHGQPLTAIMPTFYHVLKHFILQTERAEGLHLAKIKVPTPLSSFFKMSLGMTFAQGAAHGRRHMAQAQRARRAIPAAAVAQTR
jgi:hypothetical protein